MLPDSEPRKGRGILVTGASGVVGSAVVEALEGHTVVCITHQEPVTVSPHRVTGDVSEPHLGMDDAAYGDLCERIDAVVHCAAVSGYAARRDEMMRVNVGGMENVVRFCADADASLYHMSTALDTDEEYSDAPPGGRAQSLETSPFTRAPYLESKREAEAVVRSATDIRGTVVRPSIVIGDRHTGETPSFQAIHTLVRFLLEDEYGVVPAGVDDSADYLPRDTIGQAVACLIEADETPPTSWITGGPEAPTVGRVLEIVVEYGHEIGLGLAFPRFMDPEVIDRLVRPALVPELPHRARQRFEYVIEFSTALSSERVFPSDLPKFADRMDVPTTADLEEALWNSLRYWGARTPIKGSTRQSLV